MNPYEGYKVYGPYTRKDGRKHVIITKDSYNRKTVSYPKYLKEMELGRLLAKDEQVHHKDNDYTNDNPGNLEVKQGSEHAREHATIYPDWQEVECLQCGKKITLSRRQMQHRRSNEKNRGANGPFCSRQCSGKYGTSIKYQQA